MCNSNVLEASLENCCIDLVVLILEWSSRPRNDALFFVPSRYVKSISVKAPTWSLPQRMISLGEGHPVLLVFCDGICCQRMAHDLVDDNKDSLDKNLLGIL